MYATSTTALCPMSAAVPPRRPAPGQPVRRPLLPARAVAGALLCAAVLLLCARPAQAIPAFARKYETACGTCHTIYPKLNPFGEAFRRNGFRFPGVDLDMVKAPTIPLGQDANKKMFPRTTWPALLMASVPLALGVNGTATFHPDVNAGAAQSDNGSPFTLHDLVAEAHLWAGGSFTERNTFFAELTFSSAGGLSLENAFVLFNDIGGLNHAFNLWVGQRPSTLTSFAAHSSYVNDTLLAPMSVTGLYGAKTASWNIQDSYPGIELNGMFKGRLSYAVGVNAGANLDVRTTQNAYAKLGFKIGGMRLDGEDNYKAPNPLRPWEEYSLTVDGWFYRSASRYTPGMGDDLDDTVYAGGGNVRLQLRSFELNAGVYDERHNHASDTGGAVNAVSQYYEASYIIFPWLVPAVRFEYIWLGPEGGTSTSNLRITPGIAALLLPNLKLGLLCRIEWANDAPAGGWGPANGFAIPAPGTTAGPEVESITLQAAYAF